MRLPFFLSACVLALALPFVAASSQALTITLSQASSDETPASLLDATLDFQVAGGTTLSLEVTNDSDFTINQIFFNGSTDVTGLSLTGVSDASTWMASVGPNARKAGGFGTFDFAFESQDNANGIQPGDTVTFTFSIAGPCATALNCNAADFVGLDTFSSPPPAGQLAQVAAKFVQGPEDDSAYGASNGPGFPPVPEPNAFVLLGTGMLGLVLAGRRRGA